MSNFLKRTLTGAVYILVLFSGILFGKITFFILFEFVLVWCLLEFYHIINQDKSYNVVPALGASIGGLIFATFYVVYAFEFNWKYTLIFIPLLQMISIFEIIRGSKKPNKNMMAQLWSMLYVTAPFSLVLLMAFHKEGETWAYNPSTLITVFALSMIYDTAAYLAGSLLGKHKLAPKISPKKTWEGAIIGTFVTISLSLLGHLVYPQFTRIDFMVMAFIIAIFGTMGDLSESLMKRQFNVKDSGSLLPGHGGILDRMDSILFAAPMVVFYLLLFNRI